MSDEIVNPSPEATPPPEPEPDGVILDAKGTKMVPLDALIGERKRVKEATEKALRDEYEPYKQKAGQLEADLNAVRPYVERLRQKPELMQDEKPPDIPDVSNDEAEKFARRYELYTPTGLDTNRAKQMIADQRAETKRIAQEAAKEAVQPYARSSFQSAARDAFMWAASQKDTTGQPLVDPTILAGVFRNVPPEVVAQPGVAEVLLDAAIGQAQRQGKRPPQASEPTFTEAPGGNRPGYQISKLEQRMAKVTGMSEKDWGARAKEYQPDAVNILE